jgi:hypothetical protein
VAAKQRGKKQGKRIVKPSDGFVSVAYDGGRESSIVKTWVAVTEKGDGIERRKLLSGLSAHTQEGLNNPLVAGRYRYVAVRRTFSVRARLIPPTAEFVVQGGGEHVDAAIFDSDCIGAECASGNRKALVL